MRRQARFFYLTIAPIIAVALLSACNQQTEDPKSAQQKKPPPHPVIVQTVKAVPVAIDYSRTGTVSIRNKARIHAQEEGRVIHFPWFEGDSVKQGERLLRLDDTLLKAELKKNNIKIGVIDNF